MSNVRCGGVKGMLKSTSSSRRGVFVESSAEVLGGGRGCATEPPIPPRGRLRFLDPAIGSVCVLSSSK